MKSFIVVFLLGAAVGGTCVYQFSVKSQSIAVADSTLAPHDEIVFSDVIPDPVIVTVRAKPRIDTVLRIDTLRIEVPVIESREDPNILISAAAVFPRGLDTCTVIAEVNVPERVIKMTGSYNPDHETIRMVPFVTEKPRPTLELGVGAAAGLDVRGKPNSVIGVVIKVNISKLKFW